jgi:hypothetical protein
MTPIPRPAPADHAPGFADEINLVPDVDDFSAMLVDQLVETRTLVARFGVALAGLRYAPNKWSVREVIGHLADCERVLSYRALRILRGDTTVLPGFDHDAWVPEGRFESRSLVSVLEEYSAVRAATISLVSGTTAPLWSRRTVVGSTSTTAAALLYVIAGHERHHQGVLRQRYLPVLRATNGVAN